VALSWCGGAHAIHKDRVCAGGRAITVVLALCEPRCVCGKDHALMAVT
jgi:hypothetical protein